MTFNGNESNPKANEETKEQDARLESGEVKDELLRLDNAASILNINKYVWLINETEKSE
jgi:hypothetical protein